MSIADLKVKKVHSGVTLVELIIAVAVLIIGLAAVFTAMAAGLRSSTKSHELTVAGIEAQLQMESLIGRRWDDGTVGIHEFAVLPIPANPPMIPVAIPGVPWVHDTATRSGTAGFVSNGLWVNMQYDLVTARGGHDLRPGATVCNGTSAFAVCPGTPSTPCTIDPYVSPDIGEVFTVHIQIRIHRLNAANGQGDLILGQGRELQVQGGIY